MNGKLNREVREPTIVRLQNEEGRLVYYLSPVIRVLSVTSTWRIRHEEGESEDEDSEDDDLLARR